MFEQQNNEHTCMQVQVKTHEQSFPQSLQYATEKVKKRQKLDIIQN